MNCKSKVMKEDDRVKWKKERRIHRKILIYVNNIKITMSVYSKSINKSNSNNLILTLSLDSICLKF